MTGIPVDDVLPCLGRDALSLPWTEDDTALLLAAINDPRVLDNNILYAA